MNDGETLRIQTPGAVALVEQGIVLMTMVLELGTLVPDIVLEQARDMRAVAAEWGVPEFELR